MSEAELRHREQAEFWGGRGGQNWVAAQRYTDAILAPVLGPLFDAASLQPGERAVEIGCGTGATALEAAQRLGQDGHVLALDVSPPMLELARQRTAGLRQITCVLGDAATHAFQTASADVVISRFGVMFFGDPVAAFRNIRTCLRAGGRLAFVCWRPYPENPWANVPVQAAAGHLPVPPRPGPDDPGPFSFGDPARVTRILTDAGFAAPSITPGDFDLVMAPSGGIETAIAQVSQVGPASRLLSEASDAERSRALDAIRAALVPYERDGRVALGGAIWIVQSSVK